jgi:hypothetical protein
MRVLRRGTFNFDGRTLHIDGWHMDAEGAYYEGGHEQAKREMAIAALIDVAGFCGRVRLERIEFDPTAFTGSTSLACERLARMELERFQLQAPPAPSETWWRSFWRGFLGVWR